MKTHLWGIICFLALASACSSGEEEPTKIPGTPVGQIPITLNCGVATKTRVTDYGYESLDKIGLFVVNYNGEIPNVLQHTGNYVDNMRFTYHNTWKPDTDIYWKDERTKADFYCYFPHTTLSNLTSYAFTVKEDQSTEQAYKASEFLYGKTLGVAPTEQAISITTNHILSCAVVGIQAGNGFTAESLLQATISVKINGIKTAASIDLTKGVATATGTEKSIIPLRDGNTRSYKALIVPQTVVNDNFITININGKDYNLKKEFVFVGGKRYAIPVIVSKTSNGINVGVGIWEDDNVDNGGTAE